MHTEKWWWNQDDCARNAKLVEQWTPVIKAAKAAPDIYAELIKHGDVFEDQILNWTAKELYAIKEAVEALLAAEGEE